MTGTELQALMTLIGGKMYNGKAYVFVPVEPRPDSHPCAGCAAVSAESTMCRALINMEFSLCRDKHFKEFKP